MYDTPLEVYTRHRLRPSVKYFKPIIRNELIMTPIPKAKYFEHKVPDGQSEYDYFDEITFRQTHMLHHAIDRVSLIRNFK